jgi:biopolymer transport protein ExbD
MRIATEPAEGEGSGIDLTPLIDVVFQLLLFFMVTATFQNDEKDLKIRVPAAENGNAAEELPETLVVGVRQDGVFTVGSESYEKEPLRQLLARAKRKNAEQRVIVRADRDAPTRFPVTVLDLCAGLGIATSMATTAAVGK